MFKLKISLIISAISILMMSCSSMEQYTSKWNDKQIKVDGICDDWGKNFNYYQDQKVFVGIQNDNDNIYLCIRTADKTTIQKMMMLGFTIWLNNEGNKSTKVGIHYPIGNMKPSMNKLKMNEDDENGPPQGGPPMGGSGDITNASDMKKMQEKFKEMKDVEIARMLANLEIRTNDGKDSSTISVEEAKNKYNILAVAKNRDEVLTYEISIPLKSTLINLDRRNEKNNTIGLGIESGEFSMPNRSGMPPGGGPGGEMGAPPSGGMGGGMGGPPQGGMMGGGRSGGMRGGSMNGADESRESDSITKQIKLWFEVILSNNQQIQNSNK